MANAPSACLIRSVRGLAEAPAVGGLPDRTLVERFAEQGDGESFAELVRRHGAMILGVCRRVLGHEQDAEDVFQAVFLVLSRKAGALRRKEAVGPWLFGVARRLALRARVEGRERHEREARTVDVTPAGPLDELTVREARAVLDEELDRLPERERGPLVLCYLEGLTRDEAAARLGCPLGTLKGRLERARAVLERRLARRGLGLPAVLSALVLTRGSTSALAPGLQTAAVEAAVAGGAVPAQAAALAEVMLKSTFAGKSAVAAVALLAVVACGIGASLSTSTSDRPAGAVARVEDGTSRPTAPAAAEPAEQPVGPPARELKEDEVPPAVVSGVAKAVEAAKRTITVEHQGSETTFEVASDAVIAIDDKPGELAAVPVGASIHLRQFVDRRTTRSVLANGRWLLGTVQAVDAANNTITFGDRAQDGAAGRTFNVPKDLAVSIDGKPGTLAGIPTGATVNLQLFADQQTVRSLSAGGGSVFGRVTVVDAGKNTITVTGHPDERTFAVPADTNILIDGKPGTLADIPVGAELHALNLRVDQQTALNINVVGPGYHHVLVRAVDAQMGTITLDDQAPTDVAGKTCAVAADAPIEIDGRPGKLAGIPPGAFVNIGLSVDRQTIRNLQAEGPALGDCGGSVVTAVDVEKATITFADKAAAAVAGKTFAVAKNAFITIDGTPGKLTDLPTGSYVNVTLTVDGQAVRSLGAQGPRASGVVKAVDAGKGTVTVDDATYPVAKDAIVVIDGKQRPLAELPVGAEVSLNLRVDHRTVGMIQTKAPQSPAAPRMP
jgi:RNA polymerase sigma factor (sigma-70 family)